MSKYWMAAWNPATGCTPVGEACRHCWAREMATRFPQVHAGFRGAPRGECWRGYPDPRLHKDCRGCVSEGSCLDPVDAHEYPVDFSEVRCHPERLTEPLHWRKPRVVAVCFLGDWLHDDVPVAFLDEMLAVMSVTPRHEFLTLTKRPQNLEGKLYGTTVGEPRRMLGGGDYLPNLWLGVSVWDQVSADRSIPLLLDTPAARWWVSVEPQLGSVTLRPEWLEQLSWVVVGSESGPGRRPVPWAWAHDLIQQCEAASVPVYWKQRGALPDGTGRVVHIPPRVETVPPELWAVLEGGAGR